MSDLWEEAYLNDSLRREIDRLRATAADLIVANDRLRASNKELLEALEALEIIAGVRPWPDRSNVPPSHVEIARAAIAKAKEQP